MADIQLKNTVSEASGNKPDDVLAEIRIPDSYVENLTVSDMITELPKLVRGGQFVNAMKVIHGHGRFLWFYKLLDKFNRLSFINENKERPEDMPAGPEKATWHGSLKTLAEESEKKESEILAEVS